MTGTARQIAGVGIWLFPFAASEASSRRKDQQGQSRSGKVGGMRLAPTATIIFSFYVYVLWCVRTGLFLSLSFLFSPFRQLYKGKAYPSAGLWPKDGAIPPESSLSQHLLLCLLDRLAEVRKRREEAGRARAGTSA